MRVYFNGSFGNGKTTCKNWVAKEYQLKAIPEIARTVLAEREITTKEQLQKLRSDTDLLYVVQKEIIERQYKEESLLSRDFSACRGIDSVAFIVEFCQPKHVSDFTETLLFKDYVSWLKKDDVITFLVKPEKELLSQDALRDSDWDLSVKLFGIVTSLLRTNGISYHLISTSNMSERQNNISNIISSLEREKECTHVWKTLGKNNNQVDIIRCNICGYQNTAAGLDDKCILHGKNLIPGEIFAPNKNCLKCKDEQFSRWRY